MLKYIQYMIKKRLVFFIIIVLLFIPQYSFSAESLSLNSLIDECLKNNPQIRAAKYRYEAAKSRVKLLRTLADPKLEYEYDKITAGMDAVMDGKTGPMRTISLSQEIPFPTKLFLRKQSAQKEANAFEQEYKETERRVIKDLKEAFFQIYLNEKKIAVTDENLNLLSQFIEIANKKYAVNKAGLQDSLKAQVEYSKLSNQLVLLEQEKAIAQNMLNSLLNRPQGSEAANLEEKSNKQLGVEEEDILKLTKENRPELKSFREMLRKSEIDYALSKQEYLPDIMLKYKRQINGPSGAWAGSIGATVPLWFFEKQDSFVKEAKANVGVAEAEYKATENMVLAESRSAYVKFEAAKSLVKIYETGVLPQAQAAFETARSGYTADKISFLDLLDSLRTLRDFQMEYFESLANLEITLADLERTVGVDIKE
ncbi:MAG: TolC family protein [Candidatus Omnitrophota bacterium]|nr:TolC family protein [Candidatus Omnitrophota bacterium]